MTKDPVPLPRHQHHGAMSDLPRLAAALVTPFDAAGNLRHDLLSAHCRALLEQSLDALALFGSTGEALSLSVAERRVALDHLIEVGIDPRRLIVGVSASALPDAVELTRHAVAQGVRLVLAHPPVFFKDVTSKGVVDWFCQLIDETENDELKLILYHWPRLTGIAIGADIVTALRERYPSIIAGYKDSSGDFAHAVEFSRGFPNFAVYLGGASRLAPFIDAGGHGAICASANVIGAELTKLMRLQGGERKAQHDHIVKFEALLDPYGFVQGPKAVLAGRYGECDWQRVRAPLDALPRERIDELLRALRAA
jgi:4-hydroxy-tetrahydrodipicolinate synthase